MVRMAYTCGGGYEKPIVASTYLPYDLDEPWSTKKLREVTDYCHSRKRQLVTGCDADTHTTYYGGNAGTNA
jgi:hypothetical protein